MTNRPHTLRATINRITARARFYAGRALVVPVISATLVACGGDDAPDRTPTAPAPTATTAAATATTVAPSPATAAASPVSPAASPAAGTITVGDIADRIAAAWPQVRSFRTTTTVASVNPLGTPSAAPTTVTVAEVQLPDQKHWITQSDGVTAYEFISVEGRIFGRGPAVASQQQSNQPGSWFEIDPASVGSESVFSTLYAQLLAPVTAPYASLGAQERSRDAVPSGPRVIDGQTCSAYRLADTTETGERIEIVISLAANDLPCAIETRVGGQETVTVYAFNIPLTIAAPIAASPEAGNS